MDLLWLVEYLFGMMIGYYCLSPRFRRFVNGFFVGHKKRTFPLERQVTITDDRHTRPQIARQRYIDRIPTRPAVAPTIITKGKPIEVGSTNNHILVGEEELESWLNNNPDLQKLNGVDK